MNDFETMEMNKIKKTIYFVREYGWDYTLRRIKHKLGFKISPESEYMQWARKKNCSKKELEQLAKELGKDTPSVAIVIDAINATKAQKEEAKQVWKKQFFQPQSIYLVEQFEDFNNFLDKINEDVIVFSKVGLVPRDHYLYMCLKEFQTKQTNLYAKDETAAFLPEMVYTDEDCITSNKKKYFKPYFKPDMSLELLCNFQYVGTMFAVKRNALKAMDLKDADIWTNDWYELCFLCFEQLNHISHIDEVLFSKVQEETEEFIRNKNLAQKQYIERHLKRCNIAAQVVESDVKGFYHVKYDIKGNPLVSIIIANKDHIDDLDKCIQSLIQVNEYKNIEIIVVENNSTQEETFAYYNKIQQENNRIKVVFWKKEFNYSAINNFGVEFAAGELLLFLNNDTEIIAPESLQELVSYTYRPNCGATGAMLYYDDDTIQHGGVVLGIGGFAANALWSLKDRNEQYFPYSITAREFTAATAACLMVKKKVFQQIHGFDEELCVALNDVDLCMRIRKEGELLFFNPYAKLYHYESKSRGLENTPEKQERFNKEIAHFQAKWEKELAAKDPYYNKNQTLHRADYSMDYIL